jgi:TonB family protein
MILQGASDWDLSASLARRRLRRALLASAAAHIIVLFPASLPRAPLVIAQPLSITLRERPVAGMAQTQPEPRKARRTPVRVTRGDAVMRKPVLRKSVAKPTLVAMAPSPINRVPNDLLKPSVIQAGSEMPGPTSTPSSSAGNAPPASRLEGGPDAREGVAPGALRDYRFAVARMVQKRYPPLAIERGWTGTAHVRLTVGPEGMPSDVAILASSGYAVLDTQAQTSIAMAARIAALPAALLGHRFHVDLPVEFRLEELLSQR